MFFKKNNIFLKKSVVKFAHNKKKCYLCNTENKLKTKTWGQHDKFCNKIMITKGTEMELLENVAYEYITTVAGGNNGYPIGIRGAIIGFESWKQAEEFANENGLTLVSLHKCDGWQMYERGNKMWEPFKPSASWYGDDYTQFSADDYEDFYDSEVKPFLCDFDDFETLQSFVEKQKVVYEELSKIDESKLVITFFGDYYDTIDKESMEWNHDTHRYIIGAVK